MIEPLADCTDFYPDPYAGSAIELGKRYEAIQFGEYCCSEIVCTFPFNGECWCFNKALAAHIADVTKGQKP